MKGSETSWIAQHQFPFNPTLEFHTTLCQEAAGAGSHICVQVDKEIKKRKIFIYIYNFPYCFPSPFVSQHTEAIILELQQHTDVYFQ